MSKYSEKNIERFAGLAGIRKKPTPYIGPTDGNGLWTIWREPADNGVDRALAGANDMVHLVIDSNPNVYWTLDNGDGIPVGTKSFEDERGRKEKLSTFYVVTGLTHAGSNFSGDTISRGTHGLGIKTTNAMSKSFKVWTYREGQWWAIEYADGKLVKDVYKCKAPKLPHGLTAKRGTVVRFEPDLSLFASKSKMNPADVMSWCKLTSYLVPKLTVKLTNSSGKTKTLKTDGPAAYIVEKLEELKVAQTGKSFVHSSKFLNVAIAFTDAEGSDLVDSYTNGLRNAEGGEHLRALHAALVKSLDPYKGKLQYTPTDLRDGLLGLVNCKLSAPQFNNQPKDKLIDERVFVPANKELLEALTEFWKKNKSMAKDIVKRAAELRNKTNTFLKDKKMVKNVKKAQGALSTKLAAVIGSAPVERRELFLVEGDSAGGGLKKVRDRSYQAVYPLRGKPLNAMEAAQDKVNNNKEIVGVLAAIGVDLTGKNKKNPIAYGKVILFADPDVDGAHINSLLLGNLWKYQPELFKLGLVYAVKPPLFKVKYKDKIYFGETQKELQKRLGTTKLEFTYIKGWGEVDEADLIPVALDPKQRKLYKILSPSNKAETEEFKLLLGKKPEYRKKMFGVI